MGAEYTNVSPRYTPGSPASHLSEEQVERVIAEEREQYQIHLSGAYGEENKAKAEELGLAGIAVDMIEHRTHWLTVDRITGEIGRRMFRDATPRQVHDAPSCRRCVVARERKAWEASQAEEARQ